MPIAFGQRLTADLLNISPDSGTPSAGVGAIEESGAALRWTTSSSIALCLSVLVHLCLLTAVILLLGGTIVHRQASYIVLTLLSDAGSSGGSTHPSMAAGISSPPTHPTSRKLVHREVATPPPLPIRARPSAVPNAPSTDVNNAAGPFDRNSSELSSGVGTSGGLSPLSGIGGDGVGEGGSGVARPRYRENPPPDYPDSVRRRNQEGLVLLKVLVEPDGKPARVEIEHSSGIDALDDSALRTVRARWRFDPAERAGVKIESWVIVPIRFTLRSASAAP